MPAVPGIRGQRPGDLDVREVETPEEIEVRMLPVRVHAVDH